MPQWLKKLGLTWAQIKQKLESEGAKNKAYDSDVDGVLDVAAIPSLDASKITSGVLGLDRIPSLPRSKVSDLFNSPFWNNIPDKPSAYPPETHQHGDADLLSIDWSKILNKPSTYPPSSHNHDDRYYTGSEVDSIFEKKEESYIKKRTDGSYVKLELGTVTTLGDGQALNVKAVYDSEEDDTAYTLLASYDTETNTWGDGTWQDDHDFGTLNITTTN